MNIVTVDFRRSAGSPALVERSIRRFFERIAHPHLNDREADICSCPCHAGEATHLHDSCLCAKCAWCENQIVRHRYATHSELCRRAYERRARLQIPDLRIVK